MTERWRTPVTRDATNEERSAIERAVADYFDGWYLGDTERMARALHPDLAKRSYAQDVDRTDELRTATAAGMIEATGKGVGRARADGRDSTRITIDHVSGGIATASVVSEHYIEYLHLVETPYGWRIVNTVWRYADGHGPRA